MSHLVMQGSCLSDSLGTNYDLSPHARRDFGFRSTFHTANRPFRTSSAFLPKWLNFKSENGWRAQKKTTSQESTSKTIQHNKIHETNERRDGQLSTRSNKAKRSAFRLRGRLEKQKMKTNPNDLKKDNSYREGRDRRMLEQKMCVLRIIRRFYLPSLFCIGFGTVFILGSSVHSIGAGTIFWDLHKEFRIIGPAVILIGVLMLLTTVGLENRISERLKKKGTLIERNPLIHPDFLKESDMKIHLSEQSLTRSLDAKGLQIQEYRLVQTDSYIKENNSLVSVSGNRALTDNSRQNGAEKKQIHRKRTKNTEDDVSFYFYNSQITSRDHTTKTNGGNNSKFPKAMSNISVDDEVFLRSDMKSRQSSTDVKKSYMA